MTFHILGHDKNPFAIIFYHTRSNGEFNPVNCNCKNGFRSMKCQKDRSVVRGYHNGDWDLEKGQAREGEDRHSTSFRWIRHRPVEISGSCLCPTILQTYRGSLGRLPEKMFLCRRSSKKRNCLLQNRETKNKPDCKLHEIHYCMRYLLQAQSTRQSVLVALIHLPSASIYSTIRFSYLARQRLFRNLHCALSLQ